MPTTYSPLRYPGGKTQLAPLVIEVLRTNGLFYGTYAEPFAGGAGIAWKLLLDNYVSYVYINDADPAIYALWHCVLRRTDAFCEKILRTEVTMEEWHRQRAVQAQRSATLFDLGFSTFFLNRTNRSGIIKGGVIGGKQQSGQYSIDCRYAKDSLVKKIQRIALYRDQVSLHKLDAAAFIEHVLPTLPLQSLINLDPPYYAKGPELYSNHYSHQDHAALARFVRKIKQPWMVTYDNVPEIRSLYAQYRLFTQQLKYSAQVKKVGTELLILDPRLKVPNSLRASTRQKAQGGNTKDLAREAREGL